MKVNRKKASLKKIGATIALAAMVIYSSIYLLSDYAQPNQTVNSENTEKQINITSFLHINNTF